MGILGLLLLVLLVLNLPFTQRFATGKVNQILSSYSVPIHLDAIRKIMPGSVSIQGVVITGIQGDTIISVGELEADIRLISLLRRHVMLKEVILDGALVELTRKNSAEKLNIAAAFQSGKKKDAVPLKKPPAKWEISIKKGALSNIHFQMNDSLSGIQIAQDASEIEIGSFLVSQREREIFCRSIFLGEADGLVNLTPRLLSQKKKKGSPWNLGFIKLALEDVDFIFSQAADSLKLETHVGKGSVRANKLELLTRTADFKHISLDKSIVTFQTGSAFIKQKKQEYEREEYFQWNIGSENIEIKNSVVRLGSNPRNSFKEIDLGVDDLRLNKDQAAMKLKKIAFEMENGFSLKKMSGELNSKEDDTRLQFDIKSGNSRIELEGFANVGFQDILSAPEEISKGTLDLRQSKFSLRDLSFFMEDLDSLAFYNLLAASQIDVSAKLNIEGPLYSLSECLVSQEKNFNITLDGNLNNPFRLSDATGDLDLEISNLNQAWVEGFAAGFGISKALPDLSDLKVHGNISDSLKSPDIHVELNSQSGTADLAGSLEFQKELFLLAYSFERLALGEFLSVPDLGFFTGAGEIKGMGYSRENLNASFYMQIDTLEFKSYEYGHTQLTGILEPEAYEVQLVANDSSLKGDISVGLSLADSAFSVQVSGIIHAQLNDLHLYDDTLAVETSIDVFMTNNGKKLGTEINAKGMTFTTPMQTAVVQEVNASFQSDSVASLFHADADFFQMDLDLAKPFDALDSLGTNYQYYFASFRDPSHLTAADRVSDLPEINASVHLSYHKLFDIFVEDTSLQFANFDVSIIKKSDQNSLRTYIGGEEIMFKMLKTAKLNAVVSDSAGIIKLDLLADSTSIFSGPDNKWTLSGEFSDWNTLTELSVDDYQDQIIYQIEIAGKVDSSQLLLEIPSRKLTLNREHWEMEKPGLLAIDLATNRVYPALEMSSDSSFIHMHSQRQDQFFEYQVDLNQLELGSLIRTDVFTGKPDGVFTGSIDYRTNADSAKSVNAELKISDARFSGQSFDDIQLESKLTWGASDIYLIDLFARMDTLTIQLNGGKNENGDRNMDGVISHLPLLTLEPFVADYVSELGGSVSASFNVASQRRNGTFDGEVMFQDARLKVNMLNSAFRIPTQSLLIADEKMMFDNFTVLDTLNRPLKFDGFVDLGNLQQIVTELNISSSRLQVMSRDKRSKAPFTGNIFVDSRISINGPIAKPDISGNIHLSEGTEIFYHHMEDFKMTESENIVNFVSHATVGEVVNLPVLDHQSALLSSSVETVIEIDPSTMINFSLARRMFDIFLNVKGGGNIQYNLKNERMSLSGRYEIGDGTTLLKLVGWPDKSFSLSKGGFISWNGRIENPQINLEAESKVSTSYVNPIDNKTRDIDFFVILRLTDYLSDLNVQFTVRTPDQYVMSIINTLGPEEQMRQAMSVLLFEVIDLPGISSSTDYMTQQVNQILSSQLNQFTKSTIKGVDISFGLDTYDQTSTDGGDGSTTSLSYDVSKSLLNNRAQIEVSGRFNDDNQQTGSSDRSLNNVSFEYQLDSAASKYLKVYNEHNYDDVFDGEVIKTGIGFSYRKRYKSFRDIWRRKK